MKGQCSKRQTILSVLAAKLHMDYYSNMFTHNDLEMLPQMF